MSSFSGFSIFNNVLNWETTFVDRINKCIDVYNKEIMMYD